MTKLNAYNSQNDRQIEAMFSKAMIAYVNLKDIQSSKEELIRAYGKHQVILRMECLESEYEATVRCIDVFVEERVPEIRVAVIEACKEEFGI